MKNLMQNSELVVSTGGGDDKDDRALQNTELFKAFNEDRIPYSLTLGIAKDSDVAAVKMTGKKGEDGKKPYATPTRLKEGARQERVEMTLLSLEPREAKVVEAGKGKSAGYTMRVEGTLPNGTAFNGYLLMNIVLTGHAAVLEAAGEAGGNAADVLREGDGSEDE